MKIWAQFIGHWRCEITMKEKTPLSHEVVCFQMLDFKTCQRPVFSLGVSQHMHKITNLWTIWGQLVFEVAREKHQCCILCAFRCIINLGCSWIFTIFEWEIASFSKTLLLQREPVLSLFYTINSFTYIAFLVTKF